MGRVKSKNKKNKRGTLGLGSMFEAYIFLMVSVKANAR
jgi:hypothetical protein